MSKKLVADLIVDYLERRDVRYIFGLCGHTVIGMLDALNRNEQKGGKLRYISNRHEAQQLPTVMRELLTKPQL